MSRVSDSPRRGSRLAMGELAVSRTGWPIGAAEGDSDSGTGGRGTPQVASAVRPQLAAATAALTAADFPTAQRLILVAVEQIDAALLAQPVETDEATRWAVDRAAHR